MFVGVKIVSLFAKVIIRAGFRLEGALSTNMERGPKNLTTLNSLMSTQAHRFFHRIGEFGVITLATTIHFLWHYQDYNHKIPNSVKESMCLSVLQVNIFSSINLHFFL